LQLAPDVHYIDYFVCVFIPFV